MKKTGIPSVLVVLFVLIQTLHSEPIITGNILTDPFFQVAFVAQPTLLVDATKSVRERSVSYKDFDRRIVDYGDSPVPGFGYYTYSFEQGKLVQISSEFRGTSDKSYDRPWGLTRVTYETSGIRLSRWYRPPFGDRGAAPHHIETYVWKGTDLYFQGDPKDAGWFGWLRQTSGNTVKVWDREEEWRKHPDTPTKTIEVSGNRVVITTLSPLDHTLSRRDTYVDGILMIEQTPWSVDEYTVRQGKGLVVRKDFQGNTIQTSPLERRLDANGLLVFQSVRFPNGRGREIFFEYFEPKTSQ